MLLGIQILGLFVGLFLMYYTFVKHKRHELTTREYVTWMLIWLVFGILAIFPNILDPITISLNVRSTFDLIVSIGLVSITGLLFYIYTIVRKNQQDVEKLVRKIALKGKK